MHREEKKDCTINQQLLWKRRSLCVTEGQRNMKSTLRTLKQLDFAPCTLELDTQDKND